MKALSALVIIISAAALLFFGYKIFQVKQGQVTTEQQQQQVSTPSTSPEAAAADLNLRIRILRQDLFMELKTFETTREYQVNGFGAGPNSTAYQYTEAEPETAYWIANTRDPKLRRARDLQREIEVQKAALLKFRAQM